MRDPEGQKNTDPTDPTDPDPQHCINLPTLEKGNINFKQKRKKIKRSDKILNFRVKTTRICLFW